MRNHFLTGVFFDSQNPIFLNEKQITLDDLEPFATNVSPQGHGQVLNVRPAIKAGWEATVGFTIIDEAVKPEHIRECMIWIGTFNGIGSWRPQKCGGEFGRFTVIK